MNNQEKVKEFVEKYNLTTSAEIRYIDLVSEIGEIGKEILKATNYGKGKIEINKEMINEIGDGAFSLYCLCNELNISIDEALEKAISKYEKRFNTKGEIGSGE